MGIYDSIKKLGDGSTSTSKNYSLGCKVAQLHVRRGRYYDEQGRENTVKDGDLEISVSAYNNL